MTICSMISIITSLRIMTLRLISLSKMTLSIIMLRLMCIMPSSIMSSSIMPSSITTYNNISVIIFIIMQSVLLVWSERANLT